MQQTVTSSQMTLLPWNICKRPLPIITTTTASQLVFTLIPSMFRYAFLFSDFSHIHSSEYPAYLSWFYHHQINGRHDQCLPGLGTGATEWLVSARRIQNYDRLTQHSVVWIVSNEQLLDWVQNPVPVSELDKINSLKCSTPQVDPSMQICNGIPQNEQGILSHCAFSDFPFYTCVRIFLLFRPFLS
jgi:hypothetical protein